MKERPILFSGPLVRALLAGTKTQTRRLVKIPDIVRAEDCERASDYTTIAASEPENVAEFGAWRAWMTEYPDEGSVELRCPYGTAGDRLWVRETWHPCDGGTIYAADYRDKQEAGVERWVSPLFMPRHESRITLEITEVRVQRLQEISEEDAKAEGVQPPTYSETWLCVRKGGGGAYEVFAEPDAAERAELAHVEHQPARPMWGARPEFELLWNKINGDRASWASNPWVWVLNFRRAR